MTSMKRVALTLLFLLTPLFVLAQSTDGTITGRITDPSKAVIGGAKVTLINSNTNLMSTFVTEKDGSFFFSNVQPGNYRVEVEKQGFRSVIKPAVVVHVQDA